LRLNVPMGQGVGKLEGNPTDPLSPTLPRQEGWRKSISGLCYLCQPRQQGA